MAQLYTYYNCRLYLYNVSRKWWRQNIETMTGQIIWWTQREEESRPENLTKIKCLGCKTRFYKQALNERKEDWARIFKLQNMTATGIPGFFHPCCYFRKHRASILRNEFYLWYLENSGEKRSPLILSADRNSDTNQGEVTKLIKGKPSQQSPRGQFTQVLEAAQ